MEVAFSAARRRLVALTSVSLMDLLVFKQSFSTHHEAHSAATPRPKSKQTLSPRSDS
jgi:hypothetical protein